MPKKDRTKREILEAFLELAEEQEFETVTVASVCERAGLSRQTFYQYFHDRYEVTTWLLQQFIGDSFEKLGASCTWREAYLAEFRRIEDYSRRYPRALAGFTGSQDYNSILHTATRSSRDDFARAYRRATGNTPDELASWQIDRWSRISSEESTAWIQEGCLPAADEFTDRFLTLLPDGLRRPIDEAADKHADS